MKAKLLTVTAFLWMHLLSVSQTSIRNGGFEQWQNFNTNTEEPVGWNSNKTGGGNAPSGPKTCFRNSSPRSGTYCARVRTGNTLVVVNGSLTTGKVEAPTFNKADGYIRTIPTDTSYRMLFTGRPDSLVFWLKYAPQGVDRIRLEARLHKGFAYSPEQPSANNNHPDSTQNIIARALFLSDNATIANWTRFSIPFVYVDSRTPQYMLITMTPSHDQINGTDGTEMFIDDIEAIYNPVVGAVDVSNTFYLSTSIGAAINVPFTLTGNYNNGNTVTAQLCDASGSFVNPINIGSVNATTSGVINATIPANTPSGTSYKIRVVTSNAARISNNTSNNATVVLINADVNPASSQSILANVNGNLLTVTENYVATTREWKYSNTSGSGYQSFITPETGTTYTPFFANNGTYYIVCESQFNNLLAVSNEVEISVNSVTLNTGIISPSEYEFSLSSPNGIVDVPYTTSGDFNTGNTFTAQLSDATGSFANPIDIGTINAINSGVINALIPNTTISGLAYRIRVIASNPAIFGNDNGSNIIIDQFSNAISPDVEQNILENQSGAFLTVSESQNVNGREWLYSTTSGTAYQSFTPVETTPSYTPIFAQNGTYYVVCASTNTNNDEVFSNEVTINVSISTNINDRDNNIVSVWNANNNLFIDLTSSTMQNPHVVMVSLDGKEILNTTIQSNTINNIPVEVSKGIYVVKVFDNLNLLNFKFVNK